MNAKKLEAAINERSPQAHTWAVLEKDAKHISEAWKGRLPDAPIFFRSVTQFLCFTAIVVFLGIDAVTGARHEVSSVRWAF